MQYIQDNDDVQVADWFGPDTGATEPVGTANGRYKWYDAIYPYVKTEQVYTCPSDQEHLYTYYGNLTSGTTTNYGSYAINHSYRGCSTSGCPGGGSGAWTPPVSHPSLGEKVRQSALMAPGRTAWVTDATGDFCFGPTIGTLPITDASTRRLDKINERHLATTNVLWCDGHVKAVKLDLLATVDGTDTYMTYLTVQDD